jgi:hypothetical protein
MIAAGVNAKASHYMDAISQSADRGGHEPR